MHPARGPKLAHAGINDGIAGKSPFPSPQLAAAGIPDPGKLLELGAHGLFWRRAVVCEHVIGKLAPADFREEHRRTAVGWKHTRPPARSLDRSPNLTRA